MNLYDWGPSGLRGITYPDNKIHGANMGTTWVLSVPDGPHVGPINIASRVMSSLQLHYIISCQEKSLLYVAGASNLQLHHHLLGPKYFVGSQDNPFI